MIILKSFEFYFPKFIENAISVAGSPPDSLMQNFSCILFPLSESMGIPNELTKLILMFIFYLVVNLVIFLYSQFVFKNNEKRQMYFRSTGLMLNLNLFQPTLFLLAIDMLACRRIIQTDYMKGDLAIECDQPSYLNGFFAVIPVIIIMNFIIPFYFFYRIH